MVLGNMVQVNNRYSSSCGYFLLLFYLCFFFSGCGSTNNKAFYKTRKTWHEFHHKIVTKSSTGRKFLQGFGPYRHKVYTDHQLVLSPKLKVKADYYQPCHHDESPIVIFMHGNRFRKEVHADQAKLLATWGMHSLLVDLPNTHQWIKNGSILRRVVKLVTRFPEALSSKIDIQNIILVGHSFGGSAAILAAQENPSVAGLILLDPALVHNKVRSAMDHTYAPVILLGADRLVFNSKKRFIFFQHLRGPMIEVSIKGANHIDAQSPNIHKVRWGISFSSHPLQEHLFRSAIVTSAFALASPKHLKFAWDVFVLYKNQGLMKNIKVKPSLIVR